MSALLGVGKSYGMLWVGWPGVFIDEGPDRDALTETLLEKRCLPIWLTRTKSNYITMGIAITSCGHCSITFRWHLNRN